MDSSSKSEVFSLMETDIELLNAARGRNTDAFVGIFDIYAHALYNYAVRLGCDPATADNIVGDVFAKLLEHILAGKGPKVNLRSYLYQSTHNLIIDRWRSSGKSAPLEVANPFRDDVHSAPPSLEDRVMLEVVLRVIQNDLTEDQRHVIVLRFLEDFSLKETAAILGKEVSHIKVIQNRAFAKLRQRLGFSGTETIT
jgi:RNA polymerase sigma-70 factor, ECF subfamily